MRLANDKHRSTRALRAVAIGAVVAMVLAACGTEDPEEDVAVGVGEDEAPAEEAPADTEEDEEAPPYYEGATIEFIVPFGAGGGTDTIARFIAPLLTEHIAGNPDIQVVNIEGAGGVNGANEFQNRRDPDGMTILFTAASTHFNFLTGADGVEFDLLGFEPIAAFPSSHVIYANPESGVESAADLDSADEQLYMSGSGPTGGDVLILTGLEALGMEGHVESIFGYGGGADFALAFDRGEVNMAWTTSPSFLDREHLVDEGEAAPIYTSGLVGSDGSLERDPTFPDYPSIAEAYEALYGEEPSGEAWDVYMDIVGLGTNFGFGMFTHGDAPPEAVEALRQGMEAAAADPAYDEGRELIGPNDPIVGDQLLEVTGPIFDVSDDSLAWLNEFLETRYGDVD